MADSEAARKRQEIVAAYVARCLRLVQDAPTCLRRLRSNDTFLQRIQPHRGWVVSSLLVGIVLAPLVLGGCAQSGPPHVVTGGATVTDEALRPRAPGVEPKRVYVQDFKLEVAATEQGSELVQRPRVLREILAEDPAAQVKRIVDQMAASLVKDLDAAGVPAQHLEAGTPLPKDGWLVRGVFTEATSGETPRRAIIGFGAGASNMEVQVGVNDLSNNPEQSFVVFGTITDPSRLPGGVVTRNPYVIAAKFVLAKAAPKRDIERTAQAIADELIKFRDQARAGAIAIPPR